MLAYTHTRIDMTYCSFVSYSAPIKNIPLEKNVYFRDYSQIFNETY